MSTVYPTPQSTRDPRELQAPLRGQGAVSTENDFSALLA